MKIENLVNVKLKKIPENTIIFTRKTQKWCILPYPNHPNGCPNHNKNPLCPPTAEFLEETVRRYKHFYLIYAKFNLQEYKKSMLESHPNWSDKQATCLLYWQNSVKRILRDYIMKTFLSHPTFDFFLLGCGSGFNRGFFKMQKIYSMEAVGVNVFQTLRNNNIAFEIKPKRIVILTTLLCSNTSLQQIPS